MKFSSTSTRKFASWCGTSVASQASVRSGKITTQNVTESSTCLTTAFRKAYKLSVPLLLLARNHVNAPIDGQNSNRSHHNQLILKRRSLTAAERVRLPQGQKIQSICISFVKDAIHESQHKGTSSLHLPSDPLTARLIKRMNDITFAKYLQYQ